MKIPKYVAEILDRSKFAYGTQAIPGYTIAVNKRTPYSYANTLCTDSFKLIKWANEQYRKASKDDTQIAFVIDVPKETHYRNQYAIVTIYDPVMRHIEHLIQQ
jgi:hypothetical protein